MSTDKGPSKALIIGGVIIFIVVIGLVLFLVLGMNGNSEPNADDQFVDFPVSPPDNVFSQPVVQVIDDSLPNNATGQQYVPDEVRDINQTSSDGEPNVDQSELDALAYLNEVGPSASNGSTGSSQDLALGGGDRFDYEDLRAAMEADPSSIFINDDIADYFGEGWLPGETTEDVYNQLTGESWALEDRIDVDELTYNPDSLVIVDVDEAEFESCGTISVDIPVDATMSEAADLLSSDSAALCMGSAFVNGCDPTTVVHGGLSYLIGSFSGKCSYGIMVGGFANLCEAVPDPNTYSSSLNTNELGEIVANALYNQSVVDCGVYRY